MKPKRREALKVIALGFGLELVAFVLNAVLLPSNPRIAQGFSLAISFGGTILFFGCILLARAKARHWAFGLLGFLNIIGVALLWLVVDDHSES